MVRDSAELGPRDPLDLENALGVAVETVQNARRLLETQLDEIRHVYRSAFAAYRDADYRLKESGVSPHSLVSDCERKDQRLVSLREDHTQISSRLVDLAGTARRIENVIAQLDSSAKYLLTPADVLPIADLAVGQNQLQAIDLQEQERQRLAREIHDGPAQVLANAIFQMEFCLRLAEKDPDRLAGEMSRLKDDLREGLAETRYFIFDLRSDQLAEIGLAAMIRRYVDSYHSRFGIVVTFDVDRELPRLLDKKELAVFRIVQEALQNTRKHSAATHASVELRSSGGTLVAVVVDNGRGFNADAVAGISNRHFGLSSMRERAQLIDATIQISSEPGRGTRVTLRVPLES